MLFYGLFVCALTELLYWRCALGRGISLQCSFSPSHRQSDNPLRQFLPNAGLFLQIQTTSCPRNSLLWIHSDLGHGRYPKKISLAKFSTGRRWEIIKRSGIHNNALGHKVACVFVFLPIVDDQLHTVMPLCKVAHTTLCNVDALSISPHHRIS